ncbi:hypothetical protein GALMADRAFT_205243 [Galerina marginata CBS 339.88]|uniref:F-box domain-containing protein n=1 Tax=Galerina marginata (strain CBS 339.88) TaxID=685588 RepID=A0A067TS73_GALM3|nr:hypothetical protein GALMADRAFT_205243 [Galerina marginata CBS 339.88]
MLQLEGNSRRNINAIMPFEVMSRIFWFCIPQYTSADFRVENRKHMMQPAAPLLLGAVCILWRNIAWQIPSLWTAMTIYLLPKRIHFPRSLMKQWFSRAGERPLELCVYCYPDWFEPLDDEVIAIKNMDAILKFIARNGHRLRALDLHLPHSSLWVPKTFLLHLGDRPVSALENIRLHGIGWSDLDLLRLPTIKKLELRGSVYINDVNHHWTSLKTLHLLTEDLDVSEALDVIKNAPALVECKIRICWFSYPTTNLPMPFIPITCPYLARLEIEMDEEFSGPFFENLDLPGLGFLRISRAVFNEQKINAFAAFLSRSSALRELVLERVSKLENDVLVNILRFAPSVRVLRVSTEFRRLFPMWPVADNFLQALTKFPPDSVHYTGEEPVLPLLETIDLEGGSSFSWAFVCYLIHSRLQLPTWGRTDYLDHQYHTLKSFKMTIHDPGFPGRYQSMPNEVKVHLQRALDMGLLIDIDYTETTLMQLFYNKE